MLKKTMISSLIILLIAIAASIAETYTPETSNRVKINLGETPWKFTKGDPNGAQNITFVDAAWSTVGIPHTWSDTESFVNREGGGATGSMYGGVSWYRKHFTVANTYSGRKVFVEIEGAHLGAAVYINGTFIPGNSAVSPQATHVVGFIGFVVDITPYVQFGGADNVLAVKVSGNGGFFTYPGFSIDFRFGQGDYGLFRPVWMHITDKVHVPLNVYSVVNQWGTYVAAMTATDASATIKVQTNVQNESAAAASVTLTTKIVDATRTVVWTEDKTQSVPAGSAYAFDQTATVANTHLWYPAASIYGKPYLYKVYHIVKVGGTTVDVFESPLGIRVITWDKDFPYINGHQHYAWGASGRYDYPALGTALPAEQEWRDVKIAADGGAALWRPGHSSSSIGFVEACDAYGVMLAQPSGELEGTFATGGLNATKIAYKKELHRDMVIRDRNHPSLLIWEVSNGPIDNAFCAELHAIEKTWDSVGNRAESDRSGAANINVVDVISCSSSGCEISMKTANPNKPCWNAEAWGGKRSARFAWDQELAFAGEYLQNWRKARQVNCFGMAHWYLCETPGEAGAFLEGVGQAGVRSFGSSMMDFNRIPKLLYFAFKAAWTPFQVKPVVALAHHWNRSGAIRVNAFSNCPKVRLLINGTGQGEKVPNAWTGTGDGTDQNTTQLPHQCYWDVNWASGTVRAEGLDASGTVVCSDERKTAGAPHHIVLTVEPPLVKPNGETFKILANATDAAFILATVVDANGIWCPTASNIVHFSVSGEGDYRGGSDQYVTAGQPLGYHSPLDPELSAEGGMCKVAVRSTFTPGTVTVTATSSGLVQGSASYTVYPCSLGQTFAGRPAVSEKFSSQPAFAIKTAGSTVRYFISRPAFVGVEILNAGGKIIMRVPGSKCNEGWHPINMGELIENSGGIGNGVCFIRCRVDGQYQPAKRIVYLR
jgi:beta-galactosidase